MNTLIVTAATPDYLGYAHRLAASCERVGERCQVVEFPSRGSWLSNLVIKALAVERALLSQDRPVAWVDADTDLRRPLAEAGIPACDVAYWQHPTAAAARVYVFGWRRWVDNQAHIPTPAGTFLWFANNLRTRTLVRIWRVLCESYPVNDEQCLREAISITRGIYPALHTALLPEYCGPSCNSADRLYDNHYVGYGHGKPPGGAG